MGPISGTVVFVIIWWLVLFVVLPFGVLTQQETGEGVEPGSATSAPARPRLGFKFSITTVIAAVLWTVIYVVIKYQLISIR